MKEANWIWVDKQNSENSYAWFCESFYMDNLSDNVFLTIAADSRYTVYINGVLAAFGQYGDYPNFKVADCVDISQFLVRGENRIAIKVWYKGVNSFCYCKGDAGVIFEVCRKEEVLVRSSSKTMCAYDSAYDFTYNHYITLQLGATFCYDAQKEMDVLSDHFGANKAGFRNAVERQSISKDISLNPVKPVVLRERCQSKIIQQGEFIFGNSDRKSVSMLEAYLSFRETDTICGASSVDMSVAAIKFNSRDGNGIYFIVDLGREEAGFCDFDIDVPTGTKIDVSYGEHLADGRVRSSISVRNFEFGYVAKSGRQQFMHTFSRLGCRYLQFFVHAKEITVHYAGLRPTEYPIVSEPYKASNLLRQKIYDTSARTLLLCMHEHYEDTPWREQGLYNMDSRNQMLCGYYAFGEYQFARANLVLISKGQRADGMFDLTCPSGIEFPIPNFSFIYPVQIDEYVSHSGDKSIIDELKPVITKMLDATLDRLEQNGLIQDYPAPFWNFYEWKDDYDGTPENCTSRSYDLILNGGLCLALKSAAKMFGLSGDKELAEKYGSAWNKMTESIDKAFFDKDAGLYFSYVGKFDNKKYSQLGNSYAIMCGAAAGKTKAIAEKILNYPEITETTLSMSIFKYEALLNADREKYADIILNEIDNVYTKMLVTGATSFWETAIGDLDFQRAGSLCHGWSALPTYYYKLLD